MSEPINTPDQVDVEIFSRFAIEIENQFHKSSEQIEKVFRENMKDIRDLFYKKVSQFKEFNLLILRNHEVISQQYEIT